MADPVLGVSAFGVPFVFARDTAANRANESAPVAGDALTAATQSPESLAFPTATGLPIFAPTLVERGTVSSATAADFDRAIQSLQRASNLLTVNSRFAVTV